MDLASLDPRMLGLVHWPDGRRAMTMLRRSRDPIAAVAAVAASSFLLFACRSLSDTPTSPPIFPADGIIARIVVVDRGGTEQATDDLHTITSVLGMLRGISTSWGFTWHTYPSPHAMLLLEDGSGAVICKVDVGDGWVGSNCGKRERGWPPYALVPRATTSTLTAAFSAPAAIP